MVVFTCNHCGDSLQKPRVEKHYNFVCRTTKSLTCIDCLKDFRGEEYASHTKCLTEEERYAAKGAYANAIVKKGEVKQESWLEMIRSIIEKETTLKPSIRNLLNTISNYSNVPRKKPKFLNFIKSSSGGRANLKEVEEVWDIIEKYKADQQKVKEQNNMKHSQNGVQEPETEPSNECIDIKKKKKKKSKLSETVVDVENEEKSGNNIELNQEQIKSKKKRESVTEINTEEKINTNINEENNENEVKKDKKNKKSKKNETINTEIGESLVNTAMDNGVRIEENCKIEKNGLKKKTKKKKLQDTENEGVTVPKKPKLKTETVEVSEEQMLTEENFDFKHKIVEILSSKGTVPAKKLEKKIINAYLNHFGLAESSPKIVKKYYKKLKKVENIEIVGDNVILKT